MQLPSGSHHALGFPRTQSFYSLQHLREHIFPPFIVIGYAFRQDPHAMPIGDIEAAAATYAFNILRHSAAWARAKDETFTVRTFILKCTSSQPLRLSATNDEQYQ